MQVTWRETSELSLQIEIFLSISKSDNFDDKNPEIKKSKILL